MAKQMTAAEAKPGFIQRIKNFIEEVRVEMSKVTWPSREDLQVSTKVTMYLLLIMAAIIFVYDQIFSVSMMVLLQL